MTEVEQTSGGPPDAASRDAAAAAVPDRSHLSTERRNPASMDLHTMSVRDCVDLIQEEDREVFRATKRARPAVARFVAAVEPGFLAGGRLVYVGAGTSGRLGVLDAAEAPPTFQIEPGRIVGLIAGGDASLRRSSESREDDPRGAWDELAALDLDERDAVLAVAAGGTTPYALGALAFAHALPEGKRPVTGLLCCAPVDKPEAADHLIVLRTGPEILTGSTRMKAGTATKLTLNAISTTLMVRAGRVYENLMVDLRATNAKLRDRAARIVGTLTDLPRDEGFALLDRSGGSVKVAVVMHRLAVGREEAETRLAAAEDRLDRALEAQPPLDS